MSFAYTTERPILDDCSLAVERGDFLAIAGTNGAGKSTLLQLLTGALRPNRGTVEMGGRPLPQFTRREIALRAAVVPQSESATFDFTAEQVVLMGRTPHLRGWLALESEDDRRIARDALARVGMEHMAGRPAGKLSGGERQLVLIARAIAQQSPMLLLDEPTASLDLGHQQQIFRILASLNREDGATIVVVSHDLNLVSLYCRRMALLHDGRVAADGIPAEILGEDVLARIYGAELWLARSPTGTPMVGLRP